MKLLKNCVVVDDEPIARDLVANYISQIPHLKLLRQCRDAFEALEVLEEERIDILILDINMPKLSGLGMLRALHTAPEVIITSAYAEYALEGFELSVTDYLLKPFSFERFVKAIGKTTNDRSREHNTERNSRPEGNIVVKADQKLFNVKLADIRLIEAYGNYVKIYTSDSRLISRQTLSQLEEQLPFEFFIRIHKSFIVPLAQIDYIEGNQLSVASKLLPVGKVYKNQLLERLNG